MISDKGGDKEEEERKKDDRYPFLNFSSPAPRAGGRVDRPPLLSHSAGCFSKQQSFKFDYDDW